MGNIERFDAALHEYRVAVMQFRDDFPQEKLAPILGAGGRARELVLDVLDFLEFAAETHVPALESWRQKFGPGATFEVPWPPWIDDDRSASVEHEGGYVETAVRLSEQLGWRLIQASVILDYLEEYLMISNREVARRAESNETAVVDGNTVRKPSGKSLSSVRRTQPDPFLLVDQFQECKKRNRSDWVAYLTCHAVLGCELLSRFASALSKLTTFVKIVLK